MEIVKGILLFIYFVVAYWAVGETVYANRIVIGTWSRIFLEKFMVAFFFGIFLIPIAIFKSKSRK